MGTIDLITILFFLFILYPLARDFFVKQSITGLIKKLSQKRNSRVITLIHTKGAAGLFGLISSDYINIDNAEEIVRIIRETPKNKPIDLILHTSGGLVLASRQIAAALAGHPAKVTAIIPHYAMSAGTSLAFACDEILMDKNAVLGRVDPQIFGIPAVSITRVMQEKTMVSVDDKTVVLADISQKALRQVEEFTRELLKTSGYSDETVSSIIDVFLMSELTHDFPVTFGQAQKLGLNVSSDVPEDAYKILGIYTKGRYRLPAVLKDTAD